jgi:hypothetical protein
MSETKKSDSIVNLAAALIKAQASFDPILKDTKNPYYNSKYADLSGVLEATQAKLAEQGLVVIQLPISRDQSAGVVTMLVHSSGEFVASELLLPGVMDGKDGKPRFNSQSVGSAISYARRYSYLPMIGVAAEDDDGNAASKNSLAPQTKASPKAVAAPSKVNSAPATSSESRPVTEQQTVPSEGTVDTEKDTAAPVSGDSTKPNPEQLASYKLRAGNFRADLEKHGFKAAQGNSTGKKMLKYFTLTAGVDKLEDISIAQFDTIFEVLQNLAATDPKKAVEVIEEKIKN